MLLQTIILNRGTQPIQQVIKPQTSQVTLIKCIAFILCNILIFD